MLDRTIKAKIFSTDHIGEVRFSLEILAFAGPDLDKNVSSF